MSKLASRFVLIALLLLLLVNYPLLSAANKAQLVGGIPLPGLYLGCVWLLGILLLYINVRALQKKGDE